jgi:hypothetical protein
MAVRSNFKDNSDHGELSQGRVTQEGKVVRPEFYQNCPFFFTRESAEINIIGAYRGASAFLIGGGPSFTEINKEQLQSVWTMTLNNAVASYRGNANCMVDDPSRFSYSMWIDPTIQKFIPVAAFERPLWDNRLIRSGRTQLQQWQQAELKVGDCPNVVGYRRNARFEASRFLYEDTINWGCHVTFGGGRSVMLPALRILFLLGFRKVYLLGVDFEMNSERKYHFEEDRKPGAIKGNQNTYAKLQGWLEKLQPYFLAENFIVKNCNLQSKLKAFPFVRLEDALNDAQHSMGNFKNERMVGMYQTMETKLKCHTEV